MNLRKEQEQTKTVYFHIHGTRDMGPLLAPGFFKWISHRMHPDLFTKSTDLSLITLEEASATSCQHFKDIYERYTEKGNRYYLQWSGMLDENERIKAGTFLANALRGMQVDGKLRVIILGHSHGGNIGLLAARELADNKNIEFHLITVATPLSVDPIVLPAENVKSWQHFYTPKDINAAVGSMLMQDVSLSFTRRIEDVYMNEVRNELSGGNSLFETRVLPESYRSIELTKATFNDPHNQSVRPPLSDDICRESVQLLSKVLGGEVVSSPRVGV